MTKAAFSEKDLKIEWIPVKQLSVIWVEAQRLLNPKRAQKIADNFDFARFDPIRVTLPNGAGVYHIVDGQHRREAILRNYGDEHLAPCIVLPAPEPADAARLFDGINGMRWKVDPIATFKVRVTAGELTECAVNRIVQHYAYKVGPHREGSRNISAVGALIAVYQQNGAKVLSEVLQIVSATWRDDQMATNGYLLRGYGALLSAHGSKVNWGRLKDVISKKYTPGNLLAWAKQIQENSGGSIGDAVCETLRTNYNRGLPPDKRLDKKTG